MQVTSTLRFAADAALVARMLIDPEFEALIGQEIHAHECSSVVDDDAITTTFLVAAPDALKVLGLTVLKITGRIRWTEPLAAGRRRGRLELAIEKAPMDFAADLRLTEQDGTTSVVYDGDLKIKIPILGARLEKAVGAQASAIIEAGQRVGERWLASHGGQT